MNRSRLISLAVLFFALVVLSGCLSTAVVVTTTTAASAVITDNRNYSVMLDDRDLTFRIQAALSHDEQLSNSSAHLSVAVFNRIVLLVGQVPNEKLKLRAESLAKSSSRIRLFYNDITVEEAISKVARTNDSWITAKVKTVLATVSGIKSSSIKVVTEAGTVYLMGLIAPAQAELAASKVQTVAGVKKIVKLFEYFN